MKKNLLALAVAGAFAAPAAALAQGSFVQIYGTINADLQGASAENGEPLPIGATGPTSFGSQLRYYRWCHRQRTEPASWSDPPA